MQLNPMKTVALLDSNWLVRKSYHVTEDLCDDDGNPTGGIFGFLTSIRLLLQCTRPDHVIAVFDQGISEWRRRVYSGYKDRSEQDPRKEIERMKHKKAVDWQIKQLTTELLPYLGIPFVRIPDTEADDLIYVAREKVLSPLKLHTLIVSGDKDFLQLVRSDTSVYDPTHRKPSNPLQGPQRVTPENFKQVTGFDHPKQYLDFKAVIGDNSDRIPGIKGVGAVTAGFLLHKFGTLEAVYDDRAAVRKLGRRYKAVADNGRIVARNLLLMGLHFKIPSPDEIKAICHKLLNLPSGLDPAKVKSYCLTKRALDFVSNLPELFQMLREQKDRADKMLSHLTSHELRSS